MKAERDAARRRAESIGSQLNQSANKLDHCRLELANFRRATFESYAAQHPPPPSYDVVATEPRAPPVPASLAPPAISPPPPFPVPDTNVVTTTYPISNSDSALSALLPPIPMGWGTSAFFLLSAMWAFMKRRSTVVGNPYASAMSEQTSKLSDD